MNKIISYIEKHKEGSAKPVCAFIYDMHALREHAQACIQSLPDKCRLFYAIKANSDKEILRLLAPIVHGFEVASIGEIRKVREVSADIPILFGGPGKTDAEIVGAIEYKVTLIHAESLHELRRIAHIARERGAVVPILLRVNLRTSLPEATLAMGGRPTQFGVDETDVPEAIRLAMSLSNVQLQGFHLHSLSNNLDASKHAKLVAFYCQRVREWTEQFGLRISYLNAGGGIGINYADLNRQFEWAAFVNELKQVLDVHSLPGVNLLFEPGRYMTAACGYYAVEVLDLKQNHGKHYAIVRGGTHHFRLPVSWQHNHPFQVVPLERWDYPFPRKELQDNEITVAGQLCTPKDVLAKDVTVSRLRIGDVLLFRYAGAYGWAISHHDFLSHPHADHVYLD
jgi:diaminopimelate decarboxylase